MDLDTKTFWSQIYNTYAVLQITQLHCSIGKTVLSRRKVEWASAMVRAWGAPSWGRAVASAGCQLGALFCNLTINALGITFPYRAFYIFFNLFIFIFKYFFLLFLPLKPIPKPWLASYVFFICFFNFMFFYSQSPFDN